MFVVVAQVEAAVAASPWKKKGWRFRKAKTVAKVPSIAKSPKSMER